jgi:hypothetical protein
MPAISSAPQIPVGVGELVYVALKDILNYVTERQTYPPGLATCMTQVLRQYEKDRTAALTQRGIPPTSVLRYTLAASEKLDTWIAERSARTDVAQAHFDKWQKEMGCG